MPRGNPRYYAPKPWHHFREVTLFLPVPRGDWSAVKVGAKTELRLREAETPLPYREGVMVPSPVVVYSHDKSGRNQHKRARRNDGALMVLEGLWREPVGAISPESLQREGFPELSHFRRYWMARTGDRFKPLEDVWVFRMRRWRESDMQEMGVLLLKRIYREHIPKLELEDLGELAEAA